MTVSNDSSYPFDHIMIVGLGLIGGSFAKACATHFPDIPLIGVNPGEETYQLATASGIFFKTYTDLPSSTEWNAANTLILLACPLNCEADWLQRIYDVAPDFKGLITDVGSVKSPICDLGHSLFKNHFVGGHPMAGKEKSAFLNAESTLFQNRPWYLTPPEADHYEEAIQHLPALRSLLMQIGSRVVVMTPTVHDALMAKISHVPQLYATAMANWLQRLAPVSTSEGAQPFTALLGPGMRDQLRLSGSTFETWQPLIEANKLEIKTTLSMVQQQLEGFQVALEKENWEMLEQFFEQANQFYALLKNP